MSTVCNHIYMFVRSPVAQAKAERGRRHTLHEIQYPVSVGCLLLPLSLPLSLTRRGHIIAHPVLNGSMWYAPARHFTYRRTSVDYQEWAIYNAFIVRPNGVRATCDANNSKMMPIILVGAIECARRPCRPHVGRPSSCNPLRCYMPFADGNYSASQFLHVIRPQTYRT